MKVEIKVPEVGESVSEAMLGEWLKKSGETVERDEVILTLETDKASVEVVAPEAGTLDITQSAGETVPVGAVVATVDTTKTAKGDSKSGTEKSTVNNLADSVPEKSAKEVKLEKEKTSKESSGALSPSVRRLVHESGVNPKSVEGTGKGGRLKKGDILKASAEPSKTAKTEVDSRREKMSPIRKKIAERLVQAQKTAAILTTFNEVDMSAIIALRARYKEDFKEKHGVSLGFMGFFVKACVDALYENPRINAMIDGDEIVYHREVHIGVAVGTDRGLLVPVIRNCEQMELFEVEQSIRDFALKARDNKISVDDLSGGTFTISNGGVYGSLMSTPILNPPQSGILGMHKIEKRPVVIGDEVKVRPMMYLALSYDHRIVDGKEAVTFLVRVKDLLEDPVRLLVGI